MKLKLLNLVFAGVCLLGCSQNAKKETEPSFNPNATIVKTESVDGASEARVIGRSYSPGFEIKKEVEISYGYFKNHHSHKVPIEVSQPERFFLYIRINDGTYIKEVNKKEFRDIGEVVKIRYVEKRDVTYKTGAELEKIADELTSIDILSIEPKQQ
ncbi:MAG: hypothetical protein PHF67_00730 [Candidatus Nanoarchaeia archaeon]|nr:hypothetical protein [Candidatus Nanoarchaeia archaeon]